MSVEGGKPPTGYALLAQLGGGLLGFGGVVFAVRGKGLATVLLLAAGFAGFGMLFIAVTQKRPLNRKYRGIAVTGIALMCVVVGASSRITDDAKTDGEATTAPTEPPAASVDPGPYESTSASTSVSEFVSSTSTSSTFPPELGIDYTLSDSGSAPSSVQLADSRYLLVLQGINFENYPDPDGPLTHLASLTLTDQTGRSAPLRFEPIGPGDQIRFGDECEHLLTVVSTGTFSVEIRVALALDPRPDLVTTGCAIPR